MSAPHVEEVRVDGRRASEISVLDRGLQFGDGLFETIACLNGQPRFLPLHLERLELGCERLQISGPNLEELQTEILESVAGTRRAIIKVLITAGEALRRGYGRSAEQRATRITIRYPWPEPQDGRLHDGLMARTLTLRLGENSRLAGLKHCNRLEQVLTRAELASDPQADEGILFSSSGNLVSATSSNVFLVRDSCLLTPRIDRCGVAGVMRRVVLRQARQAGIPTRECELRAQELQEAEEVFLTNALIGIRPVRILDGRELTPGPITSHLRSMLEPLLNEPANA